MRKNRVKIVFNSVIFCSFIFILSANASINDPTKPIYSENGSSRIVTNPVVEEKKILLLQSILFGKNNKLAVVNGELLKEGDNVDGVSMVSIHKDHVVMKYKSDNIKMVLSKKIYINKLTGEISE